MPKRRYSRNYRRRRSSKPWYNRKYSTFELADKAAKGVWYLKGLVNSEMNTKVNTVNNQQITATGYVNHLTNIANGNENHQRTGNSIFVRSLFGRISLVHNAVGNATQHIRLILVKDKQQVSDTNPAIGDLLESSDPWSPLNSDDKGRFQVMFDKFITLSGQNPTRDLKIFRNMRQHVRYNGTNTTDIQKNGFYIFAISSTITSHPTMTFNLRTSYHDN